MQVDASTMTSVARRAPTVALLALEHRTLEIFDRDEQLRGPRGSVCPSRSCAGGECPEGSLASRHFRLPRSTAYEYALYCPEGTV